MSGTAPSSSWQAAAGETNGRALRVARAAAIGVAAGALITPPLGNAAAAVLLIAFFFVPDWRERLRRTAGSRVALGAGLFFAALVFATIVGASGPQGAASALRHLLGWRTLLVLLIAFAIFDSERAKRRLMVAFIVLACVGGLVSLGALAAGVTIRDFEPGVVLRNTVTQAMAFGVAAFFALILLATQSDLSRPQRVLLGLAAALMVGLLLFLQVGRSGQAMFVVLLLVAALRVLRGPRRAIAVAAVPVLAGLAFAVSPVMQSRFAQAWTEAINAADATEYTSMGIRVVMWRNSVELVRARPLMGYGLGGVRPAYATLIAKQGASGWKATVTDDPHNQFLNVWLEGGVVLLIAFLFFLACIATQPAPEPWRSVAIALLAAWCATSMASSHFATFNEGHLIMLFVGAMLAPPRQAGPAANG